MDINIDIFNLQILLDIFPQNVSFKMIYRVNNKYGILLITFKILILLKNVKYRSYQGYSSRYYAHNLGN